MKREAKPKARLKLTLACDRACPYCINGDPAYRARWKAIRDLSEVQWGRYRSIVISGGEPTLDLRLRQACRQLRIFAGDGPMIYLQTNGSGLTKALAMDPDVDRSIDGIGLSIHDLDEFRHRLPRWLDIARVKPVRLYVNAASHEAACEIAGSAGAWHDFQWRVWEEGCLDQSEDVFLLDGWQDNRRPD